MGRENTPRACGWAATASAPAGRPSARRTLSGVMGQPRAVRGKPAGKGIVSGPFLPARTGARRQPQRLLGDLLPGALSGTEGSAPGGRRKSGGCRLHGGGLLSRQTGSCTAPSRKTRSVQARPFSLTTSGSPLTDPSEEFTPQYGPLLDVSIIFVCLPAFGPFLPARTGAP